ncbi:MAG: NosD domain-containing protein [Candidatus Thermoplasmatota archaeon]|jgi:parallel beta-helix repeat protein|nr:NosD domain-containing protein [Candidatus Thermoplasmatota archaeon]
MKKMIALLIIFLLLTWLFIFYENAKSKKKIINILHVGGKEPGNYSFIQDAIDNASECDTIFIYNGTYYENVIVNKTVNIIGENKETTIINGFVKNENDTYFVVFYVIANKVKISNITVTNDGYKQDPQQYNNTGYGIIVKANNTTIIGNVIKGNTIGIVLENAFNNEIKNNKITNYNKNQNTFSEKNKEIGIFFNMSENNRIINNTITNFSGTGVRLSNTCKNNLLYYNNFINNTENANDSGNNSWDNTQHGNFWDDYNDADKNNDGIGDTPYKIPNGENQDNYPLMMPYDGTFRIKEFYVDYTLVFTMLIIGMVLVIIFLIPIAYFWNKKQKN